MKILFVISDLGSGGQERQLTYLLKALTQAGHNIFLATWNLSEGNFFFQEINALEIKIIDLGANVKHSGLLKLLKLNSLVYKLKPQIVQSFSFYLNAGVWSSCFLKEAKAIGSIRSSIDAYLKRLGKFRTILNLNLPYYCIANNNSYNKPLAFPFFIKNGHQVISNSIDFKEFDAPSEHFVQLKSIGIKSLSVGRCIQTKRIDLIIKAIEYLLNQGIEICHYHAGTGSQIEELKTQVTKKKLDEHFVFLGEINNVSALMRACDFFIHTSDIEGSPNVVMEAMAASLAVVSTDAGDTHYLVKSEVTGFLVPKGNQSKINEASLRLAVDRELRKKMGENGRKLVEEECSVERMAEEYLSFYQSISKAKI
ncbi:MAG: hypothetical protein DHS20C18_24730 [Saprospiraceae bacterium]|nr:MAG: hypothetical protein DHS20C18_24730 [Saprospiraceae bacterium]